MSDLLQEDQDKAREKALHDVQDKVALREDWKLTFAPEYARRVLLDMCDEGYVYENLGRKTNAETQQAIGIHGHIMKILDALAVADIETYQWIVMQRAIRLNREFQEDIESMRREDV